MVVRPVMGVPTAILGQEQPFKGIASDASARASANQRDSNTN